MGAVGTRRPTKADIPLLRTINIMLNNLLGGFFALKPTLQRLSEGFDDLGLTGHDVPGDADQNWAE